MKRCPLSRSGFGERQRAGIKMESGKRAPAVRLDATLAPMQSSRNHEMEDQPERGRFSRTCIQANCDAFTNTAEGNHFAILRGFNRWDCRAQQKRSGDLDALERLAEDAPFERIDVNN